MIEATLIKEELVDSLKTPELRPAKPPYKYNEVVPVEVVRVLDRVGAVCSTTDGYAYQGLVHISRIKNGFVTNVFDYFEEGMQLDVKFSGVNDRGELELSTIGMNIPKVSNIDDYRNKPHNNVLADKLGQLKGKIVAEEPKKEEPKQVINSDLGDIASYMQGLVGALSPGAQEMLADTVEKHGVFKFTVAMMKAAESFENDLGKLFLQEVQKKVVDGL